MKTILRIGTVLTMLVAMLVIAHPAQAAVVVYDANGIVLKDGDLISAAVAGDPDVFIVKLKPHDQYAGYKRLFLNPVIFSMYGHLGGWSRVHPVAIATRDLFETSGLFRNCETQSTRVWATEVLGEDEGVLHHVDIPGAQAVAQDAYFFDRVFCINTREENFYAKSIHAYTNVSQIPRYDRVPTPTPTPTPHLTITSVTPFKATAAPAGWWVRIQGMLPNMCTNLLNASFSRDGNSFIVTLPTETIGDVCAEVARSFTYTLLLANPDLEPGLYTVIVNGQNWTSFIIETPPPSTL